jgi:hypothetical protein
LTDHIGFVMRLMKAFHHRSASFRLIVAVPVACVVGALAHAASAQWSDVSSVASLLPVADAPLEPSAAALDALPDLSVVPPVVPVPHGLLVAAVGDVMAGSAYPSSDELPPNDGRSLLDAVQPFLSQTDVTFANLEGVMTDQPSLIRDCGENQACFRFAIPSRYLTTLKTAGINVLSVGNNHAFDAGEAGLNDTHAHLAGQVVAFGSERQPTAVQVLTDGRHIGWVGFAPHSGANRPSLDSVTQQVRALKAHTQFVIVSFHMGAEGSGAQHVTRQDELFMGNNRGNIYQMAHAAIDAGADLVIGHGPHVLRAMELYQGHLIAYSLGNFATYGRFNLKDVNGLSGILRVQLADDGQFVSGQFVSTLQDKTSERWQKGIGPVLDPQHRAVVNLQTLSQADFPESPLHIDADGTLSLAVAH